MGVIIHFPREHRPSRSDADTESTTETGQSASITILPVVRIERMDVPPPVATPNGPKKRRKRA